MAARHHRVSFREAGLPLGGLETQPEAVARADALDRAEHPSLSGARMHVGAGVGDELHLGEAAAHLGHAPHQAPGGDHRGVGRQGLVQGPELVRDHAGRQEVEVLTREAEAAQAGLPLGLLEAPLEQGELHGEPPVGLGHLLAVLLGVYDQDVSIPAFGHAAHDPVHGRLPRRGHGPHGGGHPRLSGAVLAVDVEQEQGQQQAGRVDGSLAVAADPGKQRGLSLGL